MKLIAQKIADYFLPDKLAEEDEEKYTILIGFCWITHLFAWLYVLTSFLIEYVYGIVFMTITAFGFAFVLLLIKRRVGYPIAANIYLFIASFLAIFPCTYFSGGIHSPVFPWFGLVPVVAMLLLGSSKATIIWFLLTIAAVLVFFGIHHFYQALDITYNYSAYQNVFTLICIAGLVGILFVVTNLFQSKKEAAILLKNKKNQQLETALQKLHLTQAQLVQSEKLASLGELTAGIAHEIQNPLNFVNNFSDVSKELLEELRQEYLKGNHESVQELLTDITHNLDKIYLHGRRADGIVKGMLQHSRSSNGQKTPIDINALCDEYMRLAYHGLRAKDKLFNAQFTLEVDENIGLISVVAEDFGRVLLNLLNNAFYAVNEKSRKGIEGYTPQVFVRTQKQDANVRIIVEDNGMGIPDSIKEKIFQPFFTTKPTGQGTGLGLSLSYDIVKAHGGELKVESTEGKGTSFLIQLRTTV